MKLPSTIKISAITTDSKGYEEEVEYNLTSLVQRDSCFEKLQERRELAVNSHYLKEENDCINLD